MEVSDFVTYEIFSIIEMNKYVNKCLSVYMLVCQKLIYFEAVWQQCFAIQYALGIHN